LSIAEYFSAGLDGSETKNSRVFKRVISFLPQLPDDRAAEPEIEPRDEKNDRKTQGHNEPLKTTKIVSPATPIKEQRRECNRDSLKSHNEEVDGRTRDLNPS